jgi:hypothetical protein
MKCPCQIMRNPQHHGDRCHYESIAIYTLQCEGPSIIIVHDKRGCFACCTTHAAWRLRNSRMAGHSKGCPTPEKPFDIEKA